MKGRLLQFNGRESSRLPLTPVWRLASGVECLTVELEDGRTYVEVRSGGRRQCSGLFRDPVTAAEWAAEARECFTHHFALIH